MPSSPRSLGSPVESHYRPSPVGDLVVMNPAAEVPAPYRLVTRSPSELHPHPSWVKHNLGLSVARLSAIAASWNPSMLDPISITRDGTILNSHEVCELARRRGLERVSCLEYDLDVLDRYRHSMRYFGLLAPRTKRLTLGAVFAFLGLSPESDSSFLPAIRTFMNGRGRTASALASQTPSHRARIPDPPRHPPAGLSF